MRGFLEHLAPLYSNASVSSPLHDATHAVALSAFGSVPDRQALRQEARVVYGHALQKVGAALKDPVAAKSDEILLSILLFTYYEVRKYRFQYRFRRPRWRFPDETLDTFEECRELMIKQAIMTTDKPDSAWNHHVDGAVALVKLRGTEQFKDPMSYNIFRAVRTIMVR
jgi:hypothetical protein